MTTPALHVNGLQIVSKSTPPDPNGFGPFTGIQIQKQSESPPHYGGGVLWSDGDALHWTTASGRDEELTSVTSSRIFVVVAVRVVSEGQATAAVLGGACGGTAVLLVLLIAQILGRWRAHALWERSQPKPNASPFRD